MLEELWMVMLGRESKNTKKYVQEKKWTIARAYHSQSPRSVKAAELSSSSTVPVTVLKKDLTYSFSSEVVDQLPGETSFLSHNLFLYLKIVSMGSGSNLEQRKRVNV